MSKDTQQSRAQEDVSKATPEVDVEKGHDPQASRRSSIAGLNREASAVQKKGTDGIAQDQVHDAAAEGKASPTAAMPHQDRIQASFGAHDVSKINAHVGGGSAGKMGAKAYAAGNDVVFDKQPDLHTAAHEAAHVVQQQQGVQLYGGVGAVGDTYEKNADDVADRVVAGKPAGDLLGPATRNAAPAQGQQAVQRKEVNQAAHDKADSAAYDAAQGALLNLAHEMHTAGPRLQAFMDGKDPDRKEATNAKERVKQQKEDEARKKEGDESGGAILAGQINDLFEKVKWDAQNADALMGQVDKTTVNTLAPEVMKVLGANFMFDAYQQKAVNWLAAHNGAKHSGGEIKPIVDSIKGRLGSGYDNLDQDRKDPEQAKGQSLENDMIKLQINGAQMAMDSVKAGNKDDANRVSIFIRQLDNMKTHDPAVLTHKSEFKKLQKELTEIEGKMPDVASTLAEAHNHLISLLK